MTARGKGRRSPSGEGFTITTARWILRTQLVRGVRIWLGLSLVGMLIVALPDDGSRIFSFSEDHGPSALDGIGVVVLVAGWLAFVFPFWRSRRAIGHRRLLTTATVAGLLLVFWSVATDSGSWWLLGAALSVVAQLVAAASAIRRLSM